MTDALFNGSSVRGLSLLSFLDWAHHSHTSMHGAGSNRLTLRANPSINSVCLRCRRFSEALSGARSK